MRNGRARPRTALPRRPRAAAKHDRRPEPPRPCRPGAASSMLKGRAMRVRTGRGTPHPAPGVRHPAVCHAVRLPRIRRFPPPDATCRGEAASGKRPPRGNPEVRGGGLGPLPSRVLPPLPAHADRGRDRAGSDRAAAIRGLGGTWFPPDQFLPLFHRNGRGGWGVRAAQPTRPRGARAASERTPPLVSHRNGRGGWGVRAVPPRPALLPSPHADPPRPATAARPPRPRPHL